MELNEFISKEQIQVLDSWKQRGVIDKSMMLDYTMFRIGKHIFVVSFTNYNTGYVISEIEEVSRTAFEVRGTNRCMGRTKLYEYIKQLKVRYTEQ